MGLFDNPWHILIVLLVLVLLFGSAKLPKAAKSMGEAMRIFKKEAQKLHDDDDAPTSKPEAWQPQQVTAPPQQVTAPQPEQATTQEQMADLKRQMDALQQQVGGQQGTPPTNQPG